jgi:amino acid adenylation domain-containing protein
MGVQNVMKELMHQYLDETANLFPGHIAIEEPWKSSITYRDLSALAGRLRTLLEGMGVHPGDRVGIYMRKSIDAVAAIHGILRTGAAYVPVDPAAPVARNAYILSDCSVKVVIAESRVREALVQELSRYDHHPQFIFVNAVGGGAGLRAALAEGGEESIAPITNGTRFSPDDLAYILYTSGSTGKPKGVMISHRNGTSFVNWCVETFQPRSSDRFSSHAPLHFDLSIHDIYVAFASGGTLVLIPEDIGKDPSRMAGVLTDSRISIWYSAPSALTLLLEYGNLQERDCSSLRLVLFAGEVFPIKHLRQFKNLVPHPRYFNLYGPTETNVCTFYEIPPEIPAGRTEPYPIGTTCSHLESRVCDDEGRVVNPGERGELCISGPAVMPGYWNLPEQSSRAFWNSEGKRWYRTGDIVSQQSDGNYILIGRRDRMVKRRGYRVELGEIEAALYRHPVIKEAAVIALPDQESGIRIRAFLSCRNGQRLSTIQMKQFCMDVLPPYMIPDVFSYAEVLPKTSTDKIDYQRLKESA